MRQVDVAIVGGGPGGLACALWLGRYRRSVIVYDTGEPRNEPAWGVHGYPGLLDPTPTALRGRLRNQARTAGALFELDQVVRITGEKDGFRVESRGGDVALARRVVLAFGLRDYLPDVPGMSEHYGHAVFHCSDCDGPEAAGRAVGVIGWDRAAANLALTLLHWSDRITLLTHGRAPELEPDALGVLERQGIAVCPTSIDRLESTAGRFSGVALSDGTVIPFDRLFFHLGNELSSGLASDLRCRMDEDGYLEADRGQQTSIPGCYAVGDITGHPHLAITAAAEGVRAALSIHRSLLPDDRQV